MKALQYADLRTLGAVLDAYAEMEGEEGQPIPEHALASMVGLAPSGDYRAEPAPRSDHMAEDCARIAERHGFAHTAASLAQLCRRVQVILVMRQPAPPEATYVHLYPRRDPCGAPHPTRTLRGDRRAIQRADWAQHDGARGQQGGRGVRGGAACEGDMKRAIHARQLVITTGIATVRGVGGRKGRKRAAKARYTRIPGGWWDTETGNALYGGDLGYRERRRRAKLRRRARDRDVAARLAAMGVPSRGRGPGTRKALIEWEYLRGTSWWSTAEGRRAWLAADRERKLARRAAKAALREAPTAREAGETLIRVLSEGQPFRARKEIRRAIRGLRA